MKRLWLGLALLIALLAFGLPARADNAITITSSKFTNNFRKNLLFQLDAQSSAKITQVALVVQIDGLASSSRFLPTFTPDTHIQATYTWDLGQNYVPPGVTGQYWWTVQDSAGNQMQSEKQSFRVDDPAHQWQKLSNDALALYWYAGGASFGQALFDRGVQAMKFLQQDTGVTVDRQIQIFIYGNRNDFFNALEPGATEWTGGRAFPDYSIVLIDVEPPNLDWGLGATTHELTHQVIHQRIRSPLGDLSMPHWMDEGLAVYYEDPGKVDPQFSIPVRRAIQNNTLLSTRSLSGSFPADPAAANLAYGESWSVVNFIIQHYGRDKLAQLLQSFKQGMFYDDAFMKVLGVDTDGLENEWRKSVGAQPRNVVAPSQATPTPFPTFGLSTDTTPVPTSPAGPGSTGEVTPTPGLVAVNANPIPPAGPSQNAPASPAANLCGGVFGVMALGLAGVVVQQRKLRS
jgi:hypothetical protein